LAGVTPAQRSGAPPPLAHLNSYRWRQHCNGLFQTPAAAGVAIRHTQESELNSIACPYVQGEEPKTRRA
jgi:hypothetical protein